MLQEMQFTEDWKRKLLGGAVDLRVTKYSLRIGFKPAWMQPKVHIVLSLVDPKGNVAATMESGPMEINDTLTLSSIADMFKVRLR
jgi:hypothetical protein